MDRYLALFAAIFYLATLLTYSPAPWYRSGAGRIMWSLLLSMTLIMVLATFTLWGAEFPWKPHLRIAVYVLIFINSLIVFVAVNVAFRGKAKKHG